MAVLFPKDPDDRDAVWRVPRLPEECFYCTEAFASTGARVYWFGAPEGVLLHPQCARTLGGHLIGDAREADMADGKSLWRGRARRVVRYQLLREEGVA